MQNQLRKQDSRIFEFADFRVEMAERMLKRQGQPVSLRPKLFDLLVFLLEHRGAILEKDEITSAVWGGISQGSAEQPSANLTVNISSLRHALGDDSERPIFIETVPHRGYRFIALVRVEEAAQAKPAETRPAAMSAASGGGHQVFSTVAEAEKAHGGRPESVPPPTDPATEMDLPVIPTPTGAASSVNKTAAVWRSWGWKLMAASVVPAAAVLAILAMTARRDRAKPEAAALNSTAAQTSFAAGAALRTEAVLQIDAIEPAMPPAWIGDKPIKVRGSGFGTGLSVMIVFPNKGSAMLSGTAVLNVQPNEFTVLVDFNNNPGEYRLRVNSPEGVNSDWFVFDVSPVNLLPTITEVKQLAPTAGSLGKVRIAVTGSNFLQSLHAVLFYPDGQIEYLPGPRTTGELFQIAFDPRGMTGQFKLQIQNAGKGSNLVSFYLSKP